MRLRNNNPSFEIMTFCVFAAVFWAISISAHAAPAKPPLERKKVNATSVSKQVSSAKKTRRNARAPKQIHKVKSGEFLGAIAKDRGVSLSDLMAINGIDNPDKISEGLELIIPKKNQKAMATKKGVRIVVPKGVTLSRIAEVYGVSVKRIIHANKIGNPDRLRSGQKLYIPGVSKVIELVPPPPCYKDPVTFYRVHTDVTKKISLQYCNGRLNPKAVEQLSSITGPVRKKVPFNLDGRLLSLLQKVSERFPGKRIEVISGQRTRKTHGHESFHNKGQALDFRVAGVSNKRLTNYIRTFKNAGVGYYPNSVFIHMDVRKKQAYWVDYSRPGEKSIYGRSNMTTAEIEAIREKRKAKKAAKVAVLKKDSVHTPKENLDEVLKKADAAIESILENTSNESPQASDGKPSKEQKDS